VSLIDRSWYLDISNRLPLRVTLVVATDGGDGFLSDKAVSTVGVGLRWVFRGHFIFKGKREETTGLV
jgi:hypothetical protein